MAHASPADEPSADRPVGGIEHDRGQIERAESDFVSAVERNGYSPASVFALRLAFEEAVINALRHGHKNLPNEPVEVEWSVDPEKVHLRVRDKGPGFDPENVADPTLEENIENPSGRGIMLIRAYMSEVAYNESGN
ncbi:MAG: ATP-binding protein, partial [Planctomycetota bacterium]|nr:ATP-binding protein [Planctomycetota bacterium]